MDNRGQSHSQLIYSFKEYLINDGVIMYIITSFNPTS